MSRLCAHCVDAADEVPGICPVEHVPCSECSMAWPAERLARPVRALPVDDDYDRAEDGYVRGAEVTP